MEKLAILFGISNRYWLAQNINSPKDSPAAHQSADRAGAANQRDIIAIFDELDFKKCLVEFDDFRYPKISTDINYDTNNYLNQKKTLN